MRRAMVGGRSVLLFGLALLLAAAAVSSQSTTTGTVQRVVDGDTIVVSGVGTVRLIGVDTPETVDPRKPVHFVLWEVH